MTQAWVMTQNFYWVMTETDHDSWYYFEKYSLWNIYELGILKSFSRNKSGNKYLLRASYFVFF